MDVRPVAHGLEARTLQELGDHRGPVAALTSGVVTREKRARERGEQGKDHHDHHELGERETCVALADSYHSSPLPLLANNRPAQIMRVFVTIIRHTSAALRKHFMRRKLMRGRR